MNFALMGLENGITLLLLICSFIVVLGSQLYIKSTYSKYKIVENQRNLSGFEVARKILDANNLNDIHIVESKGELTDHYDPTRKVIKLSHDIFHGNTIASASIAAHEVGHAIQDKEKYIFMNIRAAIVPIVNLVSYLGYFSIVVAIFAGLTQYLMVGLLVLIATLVFQLVTLPVEFDASKRAKSELSRLGLVSSDEESKVEGMLLAAALTYVAGLISTLINILRLIIMINNRD